MDQLTEVYPRGMIGAPNDRLAQSVGETGLPAGTRVFSADTHISVAEDIFYENFPASMKDRAPRLWYADGSFQIGPNHQSLLPAGFAEVIKPYEGRPGCSTAGLAERLADLDAEGIEMELAFQNEVLALLAWPDHAVKDLCFRIYNEHMAKVQARAPGRIYCAGLINWWDPKGARESLAQLKALDIKTFLMPLAPGKWPDGEPIEFSSEAMIPVWEEVADAGIPVSHHIGEGTAGGGCAFNWFAAGFLNATNVFREMFGRYTIGGILDRHPDLRIGWFEGGISWVAPAIQDAEHCMVSFRHMNNLELRHSIQHYWDTHMCASFQIDPVGLEAIDRIGIDRVMWATDYPHNESTLGYSRNSLRQVVDKLGAENARKVVSENIQRFLGLC